MIYHREATVFLDIPEKTFSSLAPGVCMHGGEKKGKVFIHYHKAAFCLTDMHRDDG